MDPDVGRFRPAEAETGLRIENETGVTLERLPGDSRVIGEIPRRERLMTPLGISTGSSSTSNGLI